MFKKIGKALKKFFAFFILKEPELEPREFKELSVEEYKKMPIKELLDLRYDKRTPTDELLKILDALEDVYQPGVCHCRTWH
jgi:hypothetical protein